MILSDRSILEEIKAGRIEIDPFDEACIQPSSIDLHVDRKFRTFHNARYPFIDVKKEMPELTELIEVEGKNPFILHPGEFVLGSTLERVRLPHDLVARLEDGYLTLELSNVANLPITIYPGMKIGQISFFRLTSPAEHPYGSRDRGSKYQGQRGPTASRFFEEFEGDDDADRGESDASP
jgi:dCTP deaminase